MRLGERSCLPTGGSEVDADGQVQTIYSCHYGDDDGTGAERAVKDLSACDKTTQTPVPNASQVGG